VREAGRRYDPRVLAARGELYLLGYWQARQYVEAVAETLRTELHLTAPPSPENARWLEAIHRQPSVALHLRRGDYVAHPRFQMADPLAYYRAAFAHVAARHAGLQAFVFSDDIPWARAHLALPAPLYFLDHNGGAPQEDLRLMAACQHQIIANSTFSWWAAWLNPHPAKMVCAPRTWFNHDPDAAADLLPPDWHCV
jgi:hypothetical protein